MMYADIVLPLAQPTYSFAVPEGVELQCGDAVAVQFGQRYIYTGIVWRLHAERPAFKRIKSVGARLYDVPLLDEPQMRFWEWVADYYMCTLGEVMRMALPSLAKPRGASEEEFYSRALRYGAGMSPCPGRGATRNGLRRSVTAYGAAPRAAARSWRR